MIFVSLHSMNWWTFLLIFLLSKWGLAQATLNLAPLEEQQFIVYLNGDTTKSKNGESVVIDNIQEGIHEVNVLLLDSIPKLINTRITLYRGSVQNLWIDNRSDTLLLIQSAGNFTGISAGDFTEIEGLKEGRTLASNIQVVKNSSCALPMTQSQFKQAFENVRSELFQSNRMIKSIELISKNCLSVAQLNELLFLIDNEEKKLELLLYTEDHIFNLSKASSLGEQFVLSRYKKQFNSWLITVQNQG